PALGGAWHRDPRPGLARGSGRLLRRRRPTPPRSPRRTPPLRAGAHHPLPAHARPLPRVAPPGGPTTGPRLTRPPTPPAPPPPPPPAPPPPARPRAASPPPPPGPAGGPGPRRYNVTTQHKIERACAHGAHVFTTVSSVTAEECN